MRKKAVLSARPTVWDVIRLRVRGEYLGRVYAPDEKAARKNAVKEFQLDKLDEKRLLVRRA